MTQRLTILQSDEHVDDINAENVFVIDDVFENLPVDPFDEAYETIATLDVDPIAGIPIFDMVWPKFASSFNEYATNPSGLAHLLVLYEELEARVAAEKVTELDCRGVDEYYLSLIADFAENEGLRMVSDRQPPTHPALKGYLRALARLVLVLVDHLLSLGLKCLFDDINRPTDVVFVPHLNRFGSMEPVIQAATYPRRIIVPVTTLDWLRAKLSGRWRDVAKYNPTPISCFVTPTILFREAVAVVRLSIAELLFGRFKRQLAEAIEAEFDVRLDQAISHALNHVYRTHFNAIPNLFLARQMLDVTECDSVVVGALSLRQQAFLFAAEEQNVSAFHVPHTVTLRQEQVPKTSVTHLVASPVAKKYLREEWYVPEKANVVALGRPRLADFARQRPELTASTDDLKIVVATQPYDDAVRRTFLEHILSGVAGLDGDVSIVVKIHPNEEIDFYEDITSKSDINVTVTGADLREHLTWADLTFVINTNVGMESMILGTPCVSINFWSPRTPVRPYQNAGPIPVLDSEAAVQEFFANLNAEKIADLRRAQIDYVDENYVPSENVEREIADYVHPT